MAVSQKHARLGKRLSELPYEILCFFFGGIRETVCNG